jgi:hypothetical protein
LQVLGDPILLFIRLSDAQFLNLKTGMVTGLTPFSFWPSARCNG